MSSLARLSAVVGICFCLGVTYAGQSTSPAVGGAALPPAERADRAGWIVLRLNGAPRQIGFQYGATLAKEIEDAHKAVRATMQMNTGKPWSWFKQVAKENFWTQLDQEYKDELIGQAEGLQSKGVKLDVDDVLAFNAHIEIEGYYLPWLRGQASTKQACSAFVATGSATKGGQVVMGHNLWWDYTVGQRFNLILDITPEKGHRVVMDALVGFIHSGSDFAINDAGLMLSETTMSGFKGFDPKGTPEFMRMRKAIQYAADLDQMASILKKQNNGGYANTWLMADRKTGEIGKLELGLKNVIFHRTTDGYYVGSNFVEDPKLRAEETNYGADPKDGCEVRKKRWNTLLSANKGAVDVEKAKSFLADTFDESQGKNDASRGTALCARMDQWMSGAVNSKVVDSAMCGQMTFWGRMGFSDGSAATADGVLKLAPNMVATRLRGVLKDIPSQPWVKVLP